MLQSAITVIGGKDVAYSATIWRKISVGTDTSIELGMRGGPFSQIVVPQRHPLSPSLFFTAAKSTVHGFVALLTFMTQKRTRKVRLLSPLVRTAFTINFFSINKK